MSALFIVATDRARLTWSQVRGSPQNREDESSPKYGVLALRLVRPGAHFDPATWRIAPSAAATDPRVRAGPLLFEQTEYRVTLSAIGTREVTLEHRDPLVLSRFDDEERGRFDGFVNFRSQVGVSTFRVLVDDVPEFEFDVEVFPTKLDYQTDYQEILAEVQGTLAGLAFEYLRATWQGATSVAAPAPTQVEWLTLLRSVAEELNSALRHIANRPIRGLRREPVVRRADQVHRIDNSIRSYLRRQAQHGNSSDVVSGVPVPERITERHPLPTLDTAEHRWLASQVDRIRRRLTELIAIERERTEERYSERKARVLEELEHLEARTIRWFQLDPLQAATDFPPPGFASLQLLTAPGYREAYRACMTLSLGLRLEGGPLELSVKDLNLLYEYWCYLALLRIVSDETKAPIDPRVLLEVRARGLSVLLRQGNESRMPFVLSNGRRITVRYNPTMGADALVPQRPDLLLTLEHPDWPATHLVLDAKYRLDASKEYVARYHSPGPPEDALNAMHRYRDAIVDEVNGTTRRTVVQAAALFPMRVDPEEYKACLLWRALGRIGVGAIPLLPGHDEFLRTWLRRWLDHGGWNTADKAIDHAAIRQAAEWRRAAAEPVLIGALRGEDPATHLAWIREMRLYYTPHSKDQLRLFAAGAVVFYEPARIDDEGGSGVVRFSAQVIGVRVVRRNEVATPWAPRRGDEEQVLYELGPVNPLGRKIVNKDDFGRGHRMGARRWTSRLAIERARTMGELFLETEPEWRLYEELRARNVAFKLRVRPPKLRSEEQLQGRVEFVFDGGRSAVWKGSAGFVLRNALGHELATAAISDVTREVSRG